MSTHNKENEQFVDEQAQVPSQDGASSRVDAVQSSARSHKKRKSSSAFRTISEVADLLGVQQHVLRFWETKFSHVKPLKRGGGRRYYRPEDVRLLQAIHHLLYVEGYTIKGVQKLLRDAGKKSVVANFSGDALQARQNESKATAASDVLSDDVGGSADSSEVDAPSSSEAALTQVQREGLESVLAELKELRGMIKPSSK